jgi:hypothetical protein
MWSQHRPGQTVPPGGLWCCQFKNHNNTCLLEPSNAFCKAARSVWWSVKLFVVEALFASFEALSSATMLTLQVQDTITQDRFKEYLELRKRKEHHIFTVESTNSIPAATLFTRAIRLLQGKSQTLRNML